MIRERDIRQIVEQVIEKKDCFVVKISVTPSNKIKIVVDSIEGITIDECVDISRAVESGLDRDTEDFELEVSSPGLDEPLIMHLQYMKNLGRELRITDNKGKDIKGKLIKVEDDGIIIEQQKAVKPKNEKKKQLIKKEHHILFDDIKKAKVVIAF